MDTLLVVVAIVICFGFAVLVFAMHRTEEESKRRLEIARAALKSIDLMDIPDPATSDMRDQLLIVLRYLMHEPTKPTQN